MDSKTEIVEKRVKSTIIRRRKAEAPAPVPEEIPPAKTEALKVAAAAPAEAESKPVAAKIPSVAVPEKKEAPVAETKKEVVQRVEAHPVAQKPVREEIVSKASPSAKEEYVEDKPRYGLKIVGKIDLKPIQQREASKAAGSKGEVKTTPGTRPVPGAPVMPTFKKVGEEEEEAKQKLKRPVKKTKREELEVDLEGIGKVATLTQLTRLASTISPSHERERVFEPTRSPRKRKASLKKDSRSTQITVKKASKRIIKMEEGIVLSDLAHELGIKGAEIIKKLMGMGSMVTLNQALDFDTAQIIAQDYGYEVKKIGFEEAEHLNTQEDKPEDLLHRSPVVTVMGHVDHGKTSLLDAIRKARVAQGEAGGITQHIGAYRVNLPKGSITFLDTPGHEAFTAMRARGASVTDIVILVVAADEGIMPQTVEAIHHAKAAEVPIIVAVNKMDKPEANPEKIKRQLSEHQLLAEDWGGDVIFAPVSAKSGEGIEHLLEMVLLQSEVLELKANPNKPAVGVVVESRLDKGRGPVATILIQEGTLKIGDTVIAGTSFGRVRAMINDQGQNIEQAGPSDPVEIQGLSSVPNAGENIHAVDEESASKLAEHREEKERSAKMASSSKMKLEDLFAQVQKGEVHELKIILKGDVQGSVEAIKDALNKLSTEKVSVNIIHAGVGGVTESDVMLASASNAIIVGFNVRPDIKAMNLAESESVDLKVYDIIYNAIDEIKKAMEGLLKPTEKEKYLGRAEVRNVFNITKVGTVAGCYVVDGVLQRNARVRLLRDNVIIYNGKLNSLKRFKDDAKEVQQGYECGLGLENFNDIKVGDVVEVYLIETIAAKL